MLPEEFALKVPRTWDRLVGVQKSAWNPIWLRTARHRHELVLLNRLGFRNAGVTHRTTMFAFQGGRHRAPELDLDGGLWQHSIGWASFQGRLTGNEYQRHCRRWTNSWVGMILNIPLRYLCAVGWFGTLLNTFYNYLIIINYQQLLN